MDKLAGRVALMMGMGKSPWCVLPTDYANYLGDGYEHFACTTEKDRDALAYRALKEMVAAYSVGSHDTDEMDYLRGALRTVREHDYDMECIFHAYIDWLD